LRLLRIPFRLLAVLWRLGVGYWTIRVQFAGLNNAERSAEVQRWSRQMLRALGISLHLEGEAPQQGPLMVVANHLSWLDILVVHAARHCRFVSKSEVHHWPLIGPMAAAGGTLFIERASRRDAMRVVHQMATALQSGDMLAIFSGGHHGRWLGALAVSCQPDSSRHFSPCTGDACGIAVRAGGWATESSGVVCGR